MELSGFPVDDAKAPLAIEVRCGKELHSVVPVMGSNGEFDIECADHHGGSIVVALLGGNKTACHQMVEELKGTSSRLRIPLREAFEWYAYKFSWTTMQAWHRYGGPKVAAAWVNAGVTPSNVRILQGMGVTDVNEYLVWQQACQYGAKIDLKVIREYVEHGVTTAAEALAWRRAGLQRPAQLAMWKSRGVNTPEKLEKRREKNRTLPTLIGSSS